MRFATAAMGTRFELALADDGRRPVSDLRAIGELVLREIEEWHQRLTRFEPDSWLAHVNRTAADSPARLDEDTMALFKDARDVWRGSGGAFDVTRGDGDGLWLDEPSCTLRFGRPGIAIDLGAMGKGHALDCAAALLRANGITSALLQGGTSSGLAMGGAPGAGAWRIGLTPERGATAAGEVLDLIDASFSMSDNASQPHAPDGRHIEDARATGDRRRPLPARRVVVTGPSARLTDAWSTALVVLGAVPPAFPDGDGYVARFLPGVTADGSTPTR